MCIYIYVNIYMIYVYIYLYYVCISTLPGQQVALNHKHIVSELSIPNSMDTASMALSFAPRPRLRSACRHPLTILQNQTASSPEGCCRATKITINGNML